MLRRHEPGAPLLTGPALGGAIGDGRFAEPVRALLASEVDAEGPVAAVVLDATAARTLDDLATAQRFLTPAVRRLAPGGRLLVLGPEAVDRGHLADCGRVCGFTVGDALPATYPHLLAFPLQMQLMAGRSFPLPLPASSTSPT